YPALGPRGGPRVQDRAVTMPTERTPRLSMHHRRQSDALSGNPPGEDPAQGLGEGIDLPGGRVDVRGHPDPGEVLVMDRDGDHLLPGEEVIAQLGRLDPLDADQRDPARSLVVVQRGPDGDPTIGLLERLRPSVAEVSQPRRLALVADALMEGQRR